MLGINIKIYSTKLDKFVPSSQLPQETSKIITDQSSSSPIKSANMYQSKDRSNIKDNMYINNSSTTNIITETNKFKYFVQGGGHPH